MTQIVFVNDNKITLQGSWSRENAVERHRLLADHLARLSEGDTPAQQAVLDLSNVTDLDACGCQLLALFMENIRRRGISPATCGLGELADQVALLGFSEAFTPRDTPAAADH